MSALKDPQGLGSYEVACRFRESAGADLESTTSSQSVAQHAPPHVPEQSRRDEREQPEPDHS